MLHTPSHWRFAGEGIESYHAFVEGQHVVEHGAVHKLALACALPHIEGQHDAIGRDLARIDISQAIDGPGGGLVGKPDQVHDSTHGLGNDVKSRPSAIRPAIALQPTKARDGGIDQAWIDLAQLLIAQAQLVHGAGAQVLDNHVGYAYQIFEDPAPCLMPQVQGQALLVAVIADKTARRPPSLAVGGEGWDRAPGIAPARPLDLDHFGARISKEHGAVRRTHVLFQPNHPHS